MRDRGKRRSVACVGALAVVLSCAAQAQQVPAPAQPGSAADALPNAPGEGRVHGTVEDSYGDVLLGARLTLHPAGSAAAQTAVSGDDGQFTFDHVAPGGFQILVTAERFSSTTVQGTLEPGAQMEMPVVVLTIETATSNVKVSVTRTELAEAEVHAEEQQRVLGAIPNYLVTYDPRALPLNARQKFELAWKSSIDPVTLGITAAVAGVQQADDALAGYGQGAQGYGKRYGADYGNLFIGTMLGSGAFPVLFRQDPRYFYKGTGSISSRALYAIASTVICKGDNGHWQPNYSSVLGSIAGGEISNLYYPAGDRNSGGATVENALIGVASGAIGDLFQEFLVRKLTPHLPPRPAPAQP